MLRRAPPHNIFEFPDSWINLSKRDGGGSSVHNGWVFPTERIQPRLGIAQRVHHQVLLLVEEQTRLRFHQRTDECVDLDVDPRALNIRIFHFAFLDARGAAARYIEYRIFCTEQWATWQSALLGGGKA